MNILNTVGVAPYMIVSAILFAIGLFGIFASRKNLIVILMSIELMLLSANLNLIAFSSAFENLTGQVMVMFTLTVAAAESAIGLAIVMVYYRNRHSVEVQDTTMMKG
ncbi:putative NADH-quinone oxidoreductase subunit K [Commensalibacter intestini A911]|uniref:NADH-quinone oxidoreductase subunit K n=2 Tax=Commensalibacter intestini TaxID=479936 RepID=A0A251ZX89_9PROT|nr:NADH-quinone oxidoreductase subunit NuoK [Commensalibacter intestini]EHD14745.1 putative NADH-quinone oxidoreductase subunit K [Commensalibacter intestini A911]OUI79287.1 NADH-quinone oxidoreductase subunit K [Commensalibacter intestini]